MKHRTVSDVINALALGMILAASSQAAMIGHWRFDDYVGGTASDDINGNDATWMGDVGANVWVPGLIGGATRHNDEDGGNGQEHFETATIGQLDGATALTLSIWFNQDVANNNNSTYNGLFMSRDTGAAPNAGNWGIALEKNGAPRNIDGRVMGQAVDTADMIAGTAGWHHVALVWDGVAGTKTIYFNGTNAASNAEATASVAPGFGNRFRMGDDAALSNREFSGTLDDAAMWDEALTPAQINRIYTNGLIGMDAATALKTPCPGNAPAVEYYVATNGNNGNNGSISAPLATLEAARDKIRALTTDLAILDGSTEMSMACWVYPTKKDNNDGIISSTGSSYFSLMFSGYGSGNPLEMRAQGTGLLAPNNSCPVGQWHHVAGVWKAGAIHKLYINGVEVANNASSPGGSINADNWYLGTDRTIANRYLDGNTRDVRIWNKALNASEVAALTNDPPTVPSGVVMSRIEEETFTGSQAIVLNHTPLDGGANIWIRGGRYPVASTFNLTGQDTAKECSPITYSAYSGEEVIFDGGKAISPLGFSLVVDAPTLAKLHTSAINQVYAQTITDSTLISLLSDTDTQMSADEQMLQIARYPNIGFGSVDSINTSGEVLKTDGTPGSPVGASFHYQGNYDTNKWVAELGRLLKARMVGYVSADWLKETKRIHSISASALVKLMDGTAYGFGNANVERPYVEHLLAELDEPGEWYFDDTDNKLYLWPRTPLTGATSISAWAGPAVFKIEGGCNHTHVKRLTFQNLSSGAGVDISNGENNLVAGCTFRNIGPSGNAFNIWSGTGNGILSCDIYDVHNASRCYGGSADNDSITPGGNYIENCHFRQVYSKSMYGKVTALNGAGNRFRHNLMHNHNGQTVTMAGVDHLVEFNEIFNTGIEEGDGGSFYSGASASSLNSNFRHNFWHHIICIPSLIPRAAIFSDDGDMGEVVTENVFYKAGENFKINQGAAHTGSGNVFLDSIRGIYVINGSPTTTYNNYMNYLNTTPNSNDKNNLLGRGMRDFGIDNWENTINSGNWDTHVSTYWRNRFPYWSSVLNNWKSQGSARKYNSFSDNAFYSHSSGGGDGVTAPAETSVTGSTQLANLDAFEDPSVLNFKYKEPRPAWAADIPFEKIGLYMDEYRTVVLDRDTYRGIVAEHWKNTTSEATGSYNPATINDRIYFNTGLLLQGLSTSPLLTFTNQGGTNLVFDWDYSGIYKLQSQTNPSSMGLSANWSDYPGGTNPPVDVPMNPADSTVFFRLRSN